MECCASLSGGDAEVCAGGGGRREGGGGRIVGGEPLEVLLERGVGLLGGGDVAGPEILAELAEECGDGVLLGGGFAGFAAAVMTMMVTVSAAEA